MAERKTESVIVSIAIDEVDETSALLIIGKRGFDDVKIINIVQGKEAMLLYERLTIPKAERKTESVIVSIDINEADETSALLVIGKRGVNDIEIINTFQGKEALLLYERLTIPNATINELK